MNDPKYEKLILYGTNKNLLDERIRNIESPSVRRRIFNKAKELAEFADFYGCYEKARNAVIKYQVSIGKPTLTGAAFGVAAIICKQKMDLTGKLF